MNRPRRLLLALVAALGLAACSSTPSNAPPAPSGPGSATPSAGDAFPVTLDTPTGELTIDERPTRIVSISPSATETLFAIGAGAQVVAVDKFSTHPGGTPVTDLSGYEPNVEAIAGYQPDLVVAANDSNDLVAALTKVGIPVLLSPAPKSIEDGYDNVAALGLATGHVDETAAVVKNLRADIAAALERAPKAGLRIYHELDESLYAASSSSFIGSVYTAMGAKNVADEADSAKSGYPQLTEEALITADPQLIVITDQVSYTAGDVAKRPGWQDVSAVRDNHIVTVDADIASRWGPRLPQLIDSIAKAMESVAVPAQ
jgi:iron complex transport system substrate-binding protein